MTPSFNLTGIALALSVWRLFGGLAFTGMDDDYRRLEDLQHHD